MVSPLALFDYLLRLGDSPLILGHRLSEWCGHAPILEEDIALSNIALDLIGQATLWLELAGQIEGLGRDADRLAYFRDVLYWRNLNLVEQPNRDFGYTIVRQFLYDCYHYHLLMCLTRSNNEQIQAIAAKGVKEVAYHQRHSGEWLIRLGDGTSESHTRTQKALDEIWGYTNEFFNEDDIDIEMKKFGIGPSSLELKKNWDEEINEVLRKSTLDRPKDNEAIHRGRQGLHSECLGFILAEMQFLPRAYPDAKW